MQIPKVMRMASASLSISSVTVPNTPLFLAAGIVADHYLRKQNAASDATHFSTQVGIGAHL